MKVLKNIVRNIVDFLIQTTLVFVPRKKHQKKQVLILRKDGLGDCLLFYPMLKYFREYYRDAEITLVFPAYVQSLSLLFSDMDKVIWFNHKKFGANVLYRWKFFYDLKRSGYDIAIYPVYTREYIGNVMMRTTKAQEIIGFTRGENGPYTRTITVPETMQSEFERNIYFTEQVTEKENVVVPFPTIDTTKLSTEMFISLQETYHLYDEQYAIVFPGSGAAYKNWPPERFAEVVTHMASRGITSVICGSEKELIIAEKICSHLDEVTKEKTVVLSGKTDLPTLAHLLQYAKLYFGSDTGILHLAVAVGTPSIALVGSGARGRFFPYGDSTKNHMLFDVNYAPTGEWDHDEVMALAGNPHPSILGITVDDAVQEVDSVLAA